MCPQAEPTRPRLFIGCSSEQLPVAKELQVLLDRSFEVEIWTQGLFAPGASTLPALVRGARRFDFALLVVSADDQTVSREERRSTTRDNVIFELGLFMGVLGPDRTYMIQRRSTPLSLPTDLNGVTTIDFEPHSSGNLTAALGAAATRLERVMKAAGPITAEMRMHAAEEDNEQDQAASSAAVDEPAPSQASADFVRQVVQRWKVNRPSDRESIERVVQGLEDMGLTLTPSAPKDGRPSSQSYLRAVSPAGKSAGYLENKRFHFVGTAPLAAPTARPGRYPYVLWSDEGAVDLVLRVTRLWVND